jgi:hypothetical protein
MIKKYNQFKKINEEFVNAPSLATEKETTLEQKPLVKTAQVENEYIGDIKMAELLELLGKDAEMKNNTIYYNGKEINFYSETEKLHVDNKKFDNPEDVKEYLTEVPVNNKRDFENDKMDPEFEAKSYRASRNNKRLK